MVVFVYDGGFTAEELPWIYGSSSRRHLRTEPQGRGAWDAFPAHFVRSPRASDCCSKMQNPCFDNCSKRSFLTRSRRSLRRAGFILTATRLETSMTFDPGSWTHCLVGSMSRRHAFVAAPATPSRMSHSAGHSLPFPLLSGPLDTRIAAPSS